MRITKLVALILVLALALTALNCKKSSPTEDSASDLVGTWKAGPTTEGSLMTYTSKSSPPITVDMIMFQSTIDIILRSDNSYTLTLVVPPFDINEVEEGKVSFSGNKVTLTANDYPDDAITFEYSLDGNLLSLVANDAEFDFNFDDIDDPAILKIILKKMN